MTSPLDRTLLAPSAALNEARRVFGPTATIEYGSHWAAAGLDMDNRKTDDAEEINVFGDRPLETLLVCLRSLPSKGEP